MNATMAEQTKAEHLHARLAEIDLATVHVVCTERSIGRKFQAALTRQLFAKLGIRGISVTAPNYSMAQSIEVILPKREDFTLHSLADYMNDPARVANHQAREKVQAIIARAFPNHDDRSNGQTDHYDFKWSIS